MIKSDIHYIWTTSTLSYGIVWYARLSPKTFLNNDLLM